MPSIDVTLMFVMMFSASLLGVTAVQLFRVSRSLVGLASEPRSSS